MAILIIRKQVRESKRRAQVRAFMEYRLEQLGKSPFFSGRDTFNEITEVFYGAAEQRWYGNYMVFASKDGRPAEYLYMSQTSYSLEELKNDNQIRKL